MPNVFSAEFDYDPEDIAGFRCGAANVGREAGGEATAVKLYEMPPGESVCPYHYEYEEEWLLVLAGELVLRTPQAERQLVAGELVCFPPGPDGAHRVSNRSEATARVLMFSSAREPAVAVYPDSDKVGVFAPGERFMFRRPDGEVPYYDGEDLAT